MGIMKTTIIILVIFFAFLAAPAMATPRHKKSKSANSTLFHYKAEKKFYC